MASRRPKRPSSARRNIKQETFSSFVSSSRLRHVQSILKGGSRAHASSPDAILCVTGIDSRYNDGCTELVNHLLFGFFENRRKELESSGFAEETIDDLLILVKHDSVHIYCNPVNYLYFLPYIAHWRNLKLHCLHPEKYDEDEEEAEEFKIHSFIAMVKDCKTIGIPYSTWAHPLPFDKFSIEKWPVIQAYALEGFGGGGFFTMKHEVVDVSKEVAELYSIMDPVSVEMLATEHLPLFERQWKTMLTTVDVEGKSGIAELTERKVCEPLRSYFSHGLVGAIKTDSFARYPFVLFGKNTNKKSLEAVRKGAVQSSDTIPSSEASHMVCQAVSPKGPLSCVRTYFFQASHKPYPVSTDLKVTPTPGPTDIRLLTKLYVFLVEGLLAAIQTYANSLSVEKAQSQLLEIVKKRCDTSDTAVSATFISQRGNFEFSIEAYDHHGRPVVLKEGESSPLIKLATVYIYNIPSIEHNGQTLGSVGFAEAFLESTIPVVNKAGSSLDSQVLFLTSHIPRQHTWQYTGQLTPDIISMIGGGDNGSLGRTLVPGDMAQVFANNGVSSPEEGHLHIFEQGIVFIHNQLGAVVLPKDKVISLEFFDGDSPSVVALLIVMYKPSLSPFLPAHLQGKNQQLVFVLTPKTKAYKAFFAEVLPLWRQEDQVPPMKLLAGDAQLPEDLAQMHNHLQLKYTVESSHGTVTPLKHAMASLQDLDRFLDHLKVSSVGRVPVASKDLSILLNQPYDAGGFDDDDQLTVTIITGIPGSYKRNLCTTLVNMAKDGQKWFVLRRPVDNIDTFDPKGLQVSLSQLIKASKRKKQSKKLHILLVTPGFTDIVDVITAIGSSEDPDIQRHLKIGAVTACVDPMNMYMEDRYTFPKLLDQCAEGWVNNVLFTSNLDLKNPFLEEAQKLIRAANPEVGFILADKGEVTRSTDLDLILSETAFMENAAKRARHLSCPGWSCGQFSSGAVVPPLTDLRLRFTQPLERPKFLGRLKELKKHFNKTSKAGNVYFVRGLLRFSDSATLLDVEYVTLSGVLVINNAEMQTPPPSANGPAGSENGHEYCLVFTGLDLEEEKLKDWMRTCAKQKPAKKSHVSQATLTKNEVAKIHKEHHLEALPPGWFYNGSHFVSLAGDKSDTHPNMDEFIANYIKQTNEEIDKYNAKIDAMNIKDLFP